MKSNSQTPDIAIEAWVDSMDPTLLLTVRGFLILNKAQTMPVILRALATEEVGPGYIHMYSDPEAMAVAMHCRTIQLTVFETRFRVRVLGYAKDSCTLLLAAAPLFRAIAKNITAQNRG